jgi:DNA-binding transcriptional ArsR family regulator
VLRLLRERPRAVGELVSELELSQPATSKHLRVLRDAGLVEAEVAGRFTYYRLRPAELEAVSERFAALAARAREASAVRRPC